MFFQVPLSGENGKKVDIIIRKPHAEISVEASRFLKMLGLSFFLKKKLSLCVFFTIK